ncbi:MAG: DUF6029 family protein [Porphyromonadaceae bacterium]|nr:DUF6029 family protein [Porphyromonadaceae bacterium]
MKKSLLALYALASLSGLGLHSAQAQSESSGWGKLNYSILLQSDLHLSQDKKLSHRFTGMSYLDMKLSNDYLSLGVRGEYMPHPLPGLHSTAGKGISHLYLRGKYKALDLTVGDVYEQFGSGLLLRAYEDRPLGIDNAIRGGRLVVTPVEGVRLVALGGQQRNHFDRDGKLWHSSRGHVLGTDLQLDLQSLIRPLQESDLRIDLGGSFVSKYEKTDAGMFILHPTDPKLRLNLPETTPAWSGRTTLQYGAWEVYGEYGYKWADPNRSNKYTYAPGSVAMLTASYSSNKISAVVGARRAEDFDFRSARSAAETDLRVNHLLPFTQAQTYTLAALRPYATQARGEWALQGELRYSLDRGTALGGRYGTKIKLTASYISALKPKASEKPFDNLLQGDNGIRYDYFGWGDKLFHDFGLEISRKMSSSYSFAFSYFNQYYNQFMLEQHGEHDVRSHIFVYDGKHRLSKSLGLRTELQYLLSGQADGDWMFGLVEASIGKHLIVSLSDQYNNGKTKEHYPMVAVAGTYKSHRLQLSWGRTRAGINCSGGVCRMMPETQGLYLSLNSAF